MISWTGVSRGFKSVLEQPNTFLRFQATMYTDVDAGTGDLKDTRDHLCRDIMHSSVFMNALLRLSLS